MEQKSAAYHRAAARGRRLRAEATTRWLKERLRHEIIQREKMAEEIDAASDPDADAASPHRGAAIGSSETPADNPGVPRYPSWDDRALRPSLTASDRYFGGVKT